MAWLTLVSKVVSTHGTDISGGAPLENFLDHHLGRRKGYASTEPSFLDNPDLQLPDDASDAFLGSSGRGHDTRSSVPSSTGSPPPESEASPEQDRGREQGDRDAEELYGRQTFPKRCQDLQPDAQLLDRQLFQTLHTDNCQGQVTFHNQSTDWTIIMPATRSASFPSGDITG